jgi:hypothetical protein
MSSANPGGFDPTKRVMLDIRVDAWLTIERLATEDRRDPRAYAAIQLERLAAEEDARAQAA